MNNSTNKIVFWSLFIPYTLLVLYSIICSKNGVSVGFFGDQTLRYGPEGYSIAFIFTFFRLWFVFVVCLIGQIAIVLIGKIKHKSKIKFYILGMILIYAIGDIMLFF